MSNRLCMLPVTLSCVLILAGSTLAAPVAPASRPAAGNSKPPAAQTQPTGPLPRIQCDQPKFEFGETWAGEQIEHTYIIRNTGQALLIIPPPPAGVIPGCGCTLPGAYDENIEPGKSGKLTVALNTQHQRGHITKQITVRSNDPVTPRLILTLSGTVKTIIDMQPVAGASWGQYRADSPDRLSVTLTNQLSDPWQLAVKDTSATAANSPFTIEVKDREKGKTAEVVISLRKPVKEGPHYAAFTLTTGLARQPEISIPANLHVPPALQAVPAFISGIKPPGREFNATFQLAYARTGDFTIRRVVPSQPEIEVKVDPVSNGDAHHRSVRVTLPADFRATSQPVSIEVEAQGENPESVSRLRIPIRVQTPSSRPAAQTTPRTP